MRCPAYNVLIAYIYIERYIKRQNLLRPQEADSAIMALTYNNCHM